MFFTFPDRIANASETASFLSNYTSDIVPIQYRSNYPKKLYKWAFDVALHNVLQFMLLPSTVKEFVGLRNLVRQFLRENISKIAAAEKTPSDSVEWKTLLNDIARLYGVAGSQLQAIENRYARTFPASQIDQMVQVANSRLEMLRNRERTNDFIIGLDDNAINELRALNYGSGIFKQFGAAATRQPYLYKAIFGVTGTDTIAIFDNFTKQNRNVVLPEVEVLIKATKKAAGLGNIFDAETNVEAWLMNDEVEPILMLEDPKIKYVAEPVEIPTDDFVMYATQDLVQDYKGYDGGRTENDLALDTQAVDSTGANVEQQPTDTILAYDIATETVLTVAVAADSQPIVKNLVDLQTGGTVDSLTVDLAGNPLGVLEVEDSGQIKTTEVEGVPLVTVDTSKVPTEVKEPVAIAANTVNPTTGLTPAQTAALQDVKASTVKTTTYPTTSNQAGGRDGSSVVSTSTAITDDKEFNKKIMYGGAVIVALIAFKVFVK